MVKPGTIVVRKTDEEVEASKNTEKRRKTADIIEQTWPEEKQIIASEAGASRSHVDNTLESHFEPIIPYEQSYAFQQDEIGEFIQRVKDHWADGTLTRGGSAGSTPRPQPPEGESPDYITGYMEGYMQRWREEQTQA